jgi:Tol biopolymer transport system component
MAKIMVRNVAFTVAMATVVMLPAGLAAQVIERISLDSHEQQGTGASWVPQSTRVVGANGRFVVFSSDAADLVPNDGNGVSDVFLRDRQLGTTTRISVNKDDGGDASGKSHTPSINSSGRFIAFASLAGDLVEGDENGFLDVYVYDKIADEMVRASVAASIGEPNGDSKDPYISGDGRYVTFSSAATNIVAEGANVNVDIYVRDLFLGETTKVSVRPDGVFTELNSWNPAISADGSHVVFTSGDNGLVPGDIEGPQDVFVRNLGSWDIERVSVSTGGGESNERNGVAAINSDGSVVVWWSRADNLVENDDNGQDDIFVRDRVADTTSRINVSSAGEQASNGGSYHVSITDSGRFVVFLSDANNLVDGDFNERGDIFSHDRVTGITRRHSLTPSSAGGNDYSRTPSVSPDGMYIAFESLASDFVSDDDNLAQDVFLAWGPEVIKVDGFESTRADE